jgi:hypothetical protein
VSPAAIVAYTVLFFVAWGGLAVLVAIAVCRTIREADRRARRQQAAERSAARRQLEEPRPRLDVLA